MLQRFSILMYTWLLIGTAMPPLVAAQLAAPIVTHVDLGAYPEVRLTISYGGLASALRVRHVVAGQAQPLAFGLTPGQAGDLVVTLLLPEALPTHLLLVGDAWSEVPLTISVIGAGGTLAGQEPRGAGRTPADHVWLMGSLSAALPNDPVQPAAGQALDDGSVGVQPMVWIWMLVLPG